MKRRKFIQKTTRGGTFTLLSVTGILGSATQNLKSQTDSIRRFNAGDKYWQDLTSVEDVLKAYPQRIEGLMNDLDLGRPELSGVRRAWNKGDTAAACKALLAHYRDTDQVDWLRNLPIDNDEETLKLADEILGDIYHGYGDKGKVPRLPDGHVDWTHRGPNNDRQFANRINRHAHLDTLMQAYLTSGNKAYLQRIDLDLRDWFIASGGEPSKERFGTSHLEPALRIPIWARLFYGLQEEDEFHPATRLLMLTTVAGHAEYLLKNTGRNNWVAMTQNGALTCGICWPEFTRSNTWRTQSLERLQENADNSVYPDGAQKELTATYHMVTLRNYVQAFELMKNAGQEIPQRFAGTVEGMWTYFAYVLRPDGTPLLNNDSDLNPQIERLTEAASLHDRPDWLYIATNGKKGRQPEGSPSRCFPWAGHLISRNGWDANAHWSFFDVGPSGSGHQHFDFGHISINAFGRHLLVDSGRFAYQGRIAERFRSSLAKHTRGHNTILVDGQGQGIEPKVVKEALQEDLHWKVEEAYDFIRGSWEDYDNVEGKLTHYRSMLYLRNKGWIIVDRIETDRSRKLNPLWHFHPECEVSITGLRVSTLNAIGNLNVTPLGSIDWEVDLVEGQDKPHPQGWYSERYGEYEPAPCAVYSGQVSGSTTFAWLLWPGKKDVQTPRVVLEEANESGVTITLTEADGKPKTIRIPVKEGSINL